MAGASEPVDVSTKRQRIAELARQSPEMGFTSLAHFIDIDWLREAYRRRARTGRWAWTDRAARTTRWTWRATSGRCWNEPSPVRTRRLRCVGSNPQGRLGDRDSAAGHPDLSFILHLFATELGIGWRSSGPSVGLALVMRPAAATRSDGLACASGR